MASSYGRILSIPGAAAFSVAGLIARFPMTMMGIATILAVQDLYGSYAAASKVSAANIIASAIGAPLLARMVDRHGQARVMVPALAVSALALAGMVIVAGRGMNLWILVALAAVAGGLSGSMGSLVRSRWTGVVSRPDDVHTAFSLEAVFDEVAFIVGPVLATALCTAPALPVTGGWVASLVLQFGGGMWFLSQRDTEPTPHPHGVGADGASGDTASAASGASATAGRTVLRHGPVLAVAVAFLFSGSLFGANDVAVVAFATEAERKSAAGTMLAVWAIGSLAAAVVYGSRSWRWPLWKQFLAGTAMLAVGGSTLMLAPDVMTLSILMAITGMAAAPTITSGNNIVQATVAPSQLTEGLAWVNMTLNIGTSLGSLLCGYAVDAGGSHGGYLMVAVCGWTALASTLAGSRVLSRVGRTPTATI